MSTVNDRRPCRWCDRDDAQTFYDSGTETYEWGCECGFYCYDGPEFLSNQIGKWKIVFYSDGKKRLFYDGKPLLDDIQEIAALKRFLNLFNIGFDFADGRTLRESEPSEGGPPELPW